MPSVAETRLAAALAAEAAILLGQEVKSADRSIKMATLSEVQSLIKDLQAQVAREQARAAGGSGLNYAVADFSSGA